MLEIKRLTFDAFTKDSRTMSDGHRFSGPVLSPILLFVSFFLKQNVYPKTLQNLLVKVEDLMKSVLQNNFVALKSSLAKQTPCNEVWCFVPWDPGLASNVQEAHIAAL